LPFVKQGDSPADDLEATIAEAKRMHELIERIKQAVVAGKHKDIETLVHRAVDDKADIGTIVNEGLIGAMDIVGSKFAASEIFVPEMLVSAMTMKKGLAIIKPLLTDKLSEAKGTVLIGTVKGDLHDIGKNLVSMMLEGGGFNVIDLGIDVSVEKVVEQVAKVKPDCLGLSALLTTTMPEMQKVITMLEDKGLRNKVKVMVGGAPVDAGFAEKIGADGYAKDAGEAVQIANRLMSRG
jgi:5-methyltetrahydrofolate--homocysteine methyltransferase